MFVALAIFTKFKAFFLRNLTVGKFPSSNIYNCLATVATSLTPALSWQTIKAFNEVLIIFLQNNHMAVALHDTLFVWNAADGQIEELYCKESEEDYISCVAWVTEGTYYMRFSIIHLDEIIQSRTIGVIFFFIAFHSNLRLFRIKLQIISIFNLLHASEIQNVSCTKSWIH